MADLEVVRRAKADHLELKGRNDGESSGFSYRRNYHFPKPESFRMLSNRLLREGAAIILAA